MTAVASGVLSASSSKIRGAVGAAALLNLKLDLSNLKLELLLNLWLSSLLGFELENLQNGQQQQQITIMTSNIAPVPTAIDV